MRVFSAAPTATYLPSALSNVTKTALHLPLAIMLKLPTGLYAKYCLVNPMMCEQGFFQLLSRYSLYFHSKCTMKTRATKNECHQQEIVTVTKVIYFCDLSSGTACNFNHV